MPEKTAHPSHEEGGALGQCFGHAFEARRFLRGFPDRPAGDIGQGARAVGERTVLELELALPAGP